MRGPPAPTCPADPIAALATALLLALAGTTFAQPAPRVPLAGTVRSRGDRTPLPGVEVILDDGLARATSDDQGRFALGAVPPGAHLAHLRGDTVGAVDVPLSLSPGRATEVTWYLALSPARGSVVRGRRVLAESVEHSLAIDEVKHIPGTQGDPIKAVQNLPGVARPPFGGGLLAVWGSAPEDTRTYVDGVHIPTLFHFSGLRSTVNSELLSSLRLVPGGYGAEHGRGLGGVIEIESRRPRSDGVHGFAQIDLIDLSAMVEGPITRNFEVAAAARVSWLHLFLPLLLTSDVTASPRYWDYQARAHVRPSPRDDLDLFVFGSDDALELVLRNPDPTLALAVEHHTYFHRGLLRYAHRFDSGASVTITPSVGYDLPDHRSFLTGGLPFHIADDQPGWSLRLLLRLPLHPLLRLDLGLDYQGTRFSLDRTDNVSGGLREGDPGGFAGLSGADYTQASATDRMQLYTHQLAPFAALAFELLDRRLQVVPQVRLEWMHSLAYPGEARARARGQLLVEPRLSLRLAVSRRVAVKAAVGYYHQPPRPADLSTVFGNPALGAESALHLLAGLELQITPTLRLELSGFYKDLRDLVVRGRTASAPPLENAGDGRIVGGELLLRQELWKGFFGWVSYTLSRSERRSQPGDPYRTFQYDQTHVLTVVASYRLPRGFRAGLRFRYATGNPYTPVARAYYDANSDSYLPLYGATYSARLPPFHQLDLRLDKEVVFDRWKLTVYLDLENAYAATAAEGATYNYAFTQQAYVGGLPLLPVLGVRGDF